MLKWEHDKKPLPTGQKKVFCTVGNGFGNIKLEKQVCLSKKAKCALGVARMGMCRAHILTILNLVFAQRALDSLCREGI